eukprot:s448_g46.t1
MHRLSDWPTADMEVACLSAAVAEPLTLTVQRALPQDFTIDQVLPFLGIPEIVECELSEVLHLAGLPFHFRNPPPLSELTKSWAPYDEVLDEGHRWFAHVTDSHLYGEILRCAQRDLPDNCIDLSVDGRHENFIQHTFLTVKQLPITDLLDLTGRLCETTMQAARRLHQGAPRYDGPSTQSIGPGD